MSSMKLLASDSLYLVLIDFLHKARLITHASPIHHRCIPKRASDSPSLPSNEINAIALECLQLIIKTIADDRDS